MTREGLNCYEKEKGTFRYLSQNFYGLKVEQITIQRTDNKLEENLQIIKKIIFEISLKNILDIIPKIKSKPFSLVFAKIYSIDIFGFDFLIFFNLGVIYLFLKKNQGRI